MPYIKTKWEELEIGKKFYEEIWDCIEHKPRYHEVIITELTDKEVTYKDKLNFHTFIRKNQYKEIYLYKEDPQLTLF